ncbi:WD G-beta repeat-containing protein protein [Babesia ovis]|uniref:WD G-beta repeat-containing protein protein n=1 Tax=Babesia ovis TaxID=5869 RepID=A0A9W5T873_BABOV|nr:WD G-beta repeat-containing protein protein [Babesia ovis]
MRISRVSECAGSRGSLSAVDFQPHAQQRNVHRLATASATEVQIWALWREESTSKPSTLRCLCLHTFRGHSPYEIATARWSPNGRYLASTDAGGVTHILERSEDKTRLLESSLGDLQTDQVNEPTSSQEATNTAPETKETRKYTFKYDGTASKRKQSAGGTSSTRISFDSQSVKREVVKPLTVDKSGGNFEMWTSIQSFRCPSSMGQLFDLSWAPDNRSIVGGGLNGQVAVFDIVTKQVVAKFDVFGGNVTDAVPRGSGYIKSVAWDPMTLHIAVQTSGREISIWRRSPPHPEGSPHKWTFKCVFSDVELFKKSQCDVLGGSRISWAPNGQLVAFPSAGGSHLNFAACFEVVHEDLSRQKSLFRDGKLNIHELQFAYDTADHMIREDAMLLHGHQSRIRNVRFSQDLLISHKRGLSKGSANSKLDRFLLYAQSSDDGVISIWRFKQTSNWHSNYKNEAQCLCVIQNASDEQSSLEDLAWGNNGKWLAVAASQGGLILVEFNDEETSTRYYKNWIDGLEIEDTPEISLSFLGKVDHYLATKAQQNGTESLMNSQYGSQPTGKPNQQCFGLIPLSGSASHRSTVVKLHEEHVYDTGHRIDITSPVNGVGDNLIANYRLFFRACVASKLRVIEKLHIWLVCVSMKSLEAIVSAYTVVISVIANMKSNFMVARLPTKCSGRGRFAIYSGTADHCSGVMDAYSGTHTTESDIAGTMADVYMDSVLCIRPCPAYSRKIRILCVDPVMTTSDINQGVMIPRPSPAYCVIPGVEMCSSVDVSSPTVPVSRRRCTNGTSSKPAALIQPAGSGINRFTNGSGYSEMKTSNTGEILPQVIPNITDDRDKNSTGNDAKPSTNVTRRATRQSDDSKHADDRGIDIWLNMDYSQCMDKVISYWKAQKVESLGDLGNEQMYDTGIGRLHSESTSPGEQKSLTNGSIPLEFEIAPKKVKHCPVAPDTNVEMPSVMDSTDSATLLADGTESILSLQKLTNGTLSPPFGASIVEQRASSNVGMDTPTLEPRLAADVEPCVTSFFTIPNVQPSLTETVCLSRERYKIFALNDTHGNQSAVVSCLYADDNGVMRVQWMKNISVGYVTHLCTLKELGLILIVSQLGYSEDGKGLKRLKDYGESLNGFPIRNGMDNSFTNGSSTTFLTLMGIRNGGVRMYAKPLPNFNVATVNPYISGGCAYLIFTGTNDMVAVYTLGSTNLCGLSHFRQLFASQITMFMDEPSTEVLQLQLLNVTQNAAMYIKENELQHILATTDSAITPLNDVATTEYENGFKDTNFIALLVYMQHRKVYVITQQYKPFRIDVSSRISDMPNSAVGNALSLQSIKEFYSLQVEPNFESNGQSDAIFKHVISRLVGTLQLNPLLKEQWIPSTQSSTTYDELSSDYTVTEQLLASALIIGSKSEYVLQFYEYIHGLFGHLRVSRLCDVITMLFKSSVEWNTKDWGELPIELSAFDARMMYTIGLDVEAILSGFVMPLMQSLYWALVDECDSRNVSKPPHGQDCPSNTKDGDCHRYCVDLSVPCPIDRARSVIANKGITNDAQLLKIHKMCTTLLRNVGVWKKVLANA